MRRRRLLYIVVMLLVVAPLMVWVWNRFITKAIWPSPTVPQVEAWLRELPPVATSADVKELFRKRGIRFENYYPPPQPDTPYGKIHGIIEDVDWWGHEIDVEVLMDKADHVVSAGAHKYWAGP